jgi:hypothetical protein
MQKYIYLRRFSFLLGRFGISGREFFIFRGNTTLGWAYFPIKVCVLWHQGACFNLPMFFCA